MISTICNVFSCGCCNTTTFENELTNENEYKTEYDNKEAKKIKEIKELKNEYELPFTTTALISKGAYGKVFRGIYKKKQTNTLCAIKQIEESKFYKNEYRVAYLASKNNSFRLCNLWDIYKYDSKYFLIYQKYNRGDLFDYCTKRIIPYYDVKYLVRQILYCVKELHELGFVHLDLKLENFLISDNGKIILTDFGCCHKLHSNTNMIAPTKFRVGTYSYIAPELNLHYYSEKTDVWAIGVCIYVLLTKQPLYYNLIDFMKQHTDNNDVFKIKTLHLLNDPDNLESLIIKMIEPIIKKRISIEDSIKHIEKMDEIIMFDEEPLTF